MTLAILDEDQINRVKHTVMPGEHFVSWEPAEIFTLLGSCVAACIWDSKRKIGGMNHFMLPDVPAENMDLSKGSYPLRYGLFAMERLVNDLLVMGSKRENLVVKVFGGANMTGASGSANVGKRNSEFVLDFLRRDNIRVAGVDLGGIHCRRIRFLTDTGKVRVYRRDAGDNKAIEREAQYSLKIKSDPDKGGDIVFF